MTKHYQQERKFTPQAERLLRSVADQPWAVDDWGLIRVLNPDGSAVCPVCMIVNRRLKRWAYVGGAVQANAEIGRPIPPLEVGIIMSAADEPESPYRKRLVRLLGGLRVRGEDGKPVVK